ncbi:hypothetical protein N7462_003021 [Penicillium macrosclerotiorum]|uniref:uncharacterized protein n=1 Tax=Penicillium macrosclerotiorum TaxID=303699 RepID=UPI00254903E7|nr:uncharacterized protein N7462_003021 [Penicillium macrosclerotiorum]KAJ5688629.1 hypothetical protein N7462_003021 [Penicillium macrosclerotiorum]
MTVPSRQDTLHDLVFLPRDIFWLVVGYLPLKDVVRCRRVSQAWNEAFGNPAVLSPLLKWHFPWTQEAKDLKASSDPSDTSSVLDPSGSTIRRAFDQVVARYDHIERGTPRSVQRYPLCDDFGRSGDPEWFQVQSWASHASHPRLDVDRQFSESMWTYEDGLVVFPSAAHQCLVLLDLNSDRQFMVPFVVQGKVTRRVRLQQRVLVVEWAELKAFHWLNESDSVHRHYASSFDVTPKSDNGWSITPRNEWKIMFLGHPLSERDRFFSAHTQTHYVIYIWQPNRSLYTADEDAPIESLFVWDFSKTSSYRPFLDPTGSETGPEVDQSPSIVARFGYRELAFFDIRQRGSPSLQHLAVTTDGQAIEVTENTCERRQGAPETLITSIPLEGNGPHNFSRPHSVLPVYRSNCSFQTMSSDLDGPVDQFSILAQVTNTEADLRFILHFDHSKVEIQDWNTPRARDTINLTIQTSFAHLTIGALDFSGRAKICGSDRYLMGENCKRELVIHRFDR